MIQENQHVARFKLQLLDVMQQEAFQCRAVCFAKHANVYTCGDYGETVYLIESGQIKLLMRSPEGRECLLAIHTAGDIFGELCLTGQGERQETAVAMQETVVRLIPCAQFFLRLSDARLLAGFLQYLALRIANQQAMIANLVMADSEHRLGQMLLHLAHTLGRQDRRSIRIEQRITHEELSAMVGTTRPRISTFMQHFQALGLIELSAEHYLIVKEQNLTAYLTRGVRIGCGHSPSPS